MSRFSIQDFSCPVCSVPFKAKVVEAVSHEGQDTDFFPHYIGEDPLPHFIIQCTECNYCAYPDDFSIPFHKDTHPRQKQIKAILEQPLAKKLSVSAQRYYLAGKLYELKKRNSYFTGNLYLRGSWCCRQAADRRGEIELQQLAVKFLKDAVDHSKVSSPENLPIVTYLVGEIYRRLEDRVAAREWFGNVEELVIDQEQQWIIELAKKQAELNEYYIN
ncbi:MAG: DUF2225 domain-containing protein [Candidatus Riflebacteria bacterium]|nr:DUF2225 domain-containing protein [Candidatus Riflebacteria bacterium]